jgi:hypothetical protein
MTGVGIVILFFCAVGAASVLIWIARQFGKLNQRFLVKQPTESAKPKEPKEPKFIRIGHARKLVSFDDLPDANKYNGLTWLGGLPVPADVVVPDKHNYATVVYMDHWFKQYVYDVMIDFSGKWNLEGVVYRLLALTALLVAFNPVVVLAFTGLFYVWAILWFSPATYRAVRRSAENAKCFTPDTWREIYKEVAESQEREDELVRALRRSGIRRL